MLKRTSLNFVNNVLSKNPNWRILDIGCGYRPNKYANVIADTKDFSQFHKDKIFIKIKDKKLPFKDKEFDFVIASHVIEHVDDFEFFIKELERISSKGYIELPSRLGDNLVFENKKDHIWWCVFDDINNQLIMDISKLCKELSKEFSIIRIINNKTPLFEQNKPKKMIKKVKNYITNSLFYNFVDKNILKSHNDELIKTILEI